LTGDFVAVLAAVEVVVVVAADLLEDVEVGLITVDLGSGGFFAGAGAAVAGVVVLGTTLRGDVAGVPVVGVARFTVLVVADGFVVEAGVAEALAARAFEAAVGADNRLVLDEGVDPMGATDGRAGLGAVVALDKVVGLDVGGGFDSLRGFEAVEVEVEVVCLEPDPTRDLIVVDDTEVEVGLVGFVTLSAGLGVGGSATAEFASASAVVGVGCASFVDESSTGFIDDISVPSVSAAGIGSPGLDIGSLAGGTAACCISFCLQAGTSAPDVFGISDDLTAGDRGPLCTLKAEVLAPVYWGLSGGGFPADKAP